MLFRRRHELNWIERVRTFVWPKSGWLRAIQYGWLRVWRIDGSPHVIAIGFAAGAASSFTPFLGLHFLVGFGLAWVLGGSLVASMLGTAVGNPATFPFIWLATYNVGNWILYGAEAADAVPIQPTYREVAAFNMDSLGSVVGPMVVGSIPLGLVASIVCYFVSRSAVKGYQNRRRRRLKERDNILPKQL